VQNGDYFQMKGMPGSGRDSFFTLSRQYLRLEMTAESRKLLSTGSRGNANKLHAAATVLAWLLFQADPGLGLLMAAVPLGLANFYQTRLKLTSSCTC
jgi:hypothetical protein